MKQLLATHNYAYNSYRLRIITHKTATFELSITELHVFICTPCAAKTPFFGKMVTLERHRGAPNECLLLVGVEVAISARWVAGPGYTACDIDYV